MPRFWVTLYYGYCLFQLGFLSTCGVRGQTQAPLNEIPSPVWWKGNSVTFYKYRNDGSCRQLALNASVPNYNDINGYVGFNQNGAWFGGADKITFKMDGTSCVRVSTHRGEWVQMLFQSGQQGCSMGGYSIMGDLRYYSTPECTLNGHMNQVTFMDMGGSIIMDGNGCFNDRGVSSNFPVYYRAFCDVTAPVTQQVFPREERTIFVTNNLTNTIVQPHFITNNITTYIPTVVTNNITTYVPSIVKPEDLIPLIQHLMVKNASIFKTLSANAPAFISAPNNQKQQSSSTDIAVHLFLWSLLILPVLFRYF